LPLEAGHSWGWWVDSSVNHVRKPFRYRVSLSFFDAFCFSSQFG